MVTTRKIKRRTLKSTAVTITVTEDASYANVRRLARAGIVLEDFVPQSLASISVDRKPSLVVDIPGRRAG